MTKVYSLELQSKKPSNNFVNEALTDSNNVLSESGQIDLSNSRESGRKYNSIYVSIETLKNSESKVCIKSSIGMNLQAKAPKAREVGSHLLQSGLTQYAKSTIRKSARLLHHSVKGNLASFITLTYGRDIPSHIEAKKHLYLFLKRMRRLYGNFMYVWVAENQKRGAIHFHIAANQYVPKELINKHWNEVVSKWQRSQGYDVQKLRPNVKGVEQIGSYMSKYISKESGKIGGNMYGISTELRDSMKPKVHTIEITANHELTKEVCNDVFISALNTLDKNDERAKYFTYSKYSNGGIWLSNTNEFLLNEFINYHLPEIKNEFENIPLPKE
jgi:hypothetical protein